MGWNRDISQAPSGHHETREVVIKGKTVTRDVFVPAPIIVACRDGETVLSSRWLPEGKERKVGRWNCLATDEEPIAWMPWPTHPEAK